MEEGSAVPESIHEPRLSRVSRLPSVTSITSVGPSASVMCALARFRCTRCYTLPAGPVARYCHRCGSVLGISPSASSCNEVREVKSDSTRRNKLRRNGSEPKSAVPSHRVSRMASAEPSSRKRDVNSVLNWLKKEHLVAEWVTLMRPRGRTT